MKLKQVLFLIILSLNISTIYSQKAKVAAAYKLYGRYAYIDAIATYERVAKKGYKDEKMFQKLENAYYFNVELEKVVKWYEKLFSMNQEQEPEYYYRYSQCLKSVGDYEKSDKMLAEFNKKYGMIKEQNYSKKIKTI